MTSGGLLLAAACAPPPPPNVPSERQTIHHLALPGLSPERLGYLLFVPVGHDSGTERWPLILFLHGSGEGGDRVADVAREGLPWELRDRRHFPFVVVSPQSPHGREWPLPAVEALLAEVTGRLRIDPGRVYATGLSSGGSAALELAARSPGRFTAVAVVSIDRGPEEPCRLRGVPIRIYHNRGDERIPVSRPRRIAKLLGSCGIDVTLTVYPESGHDAWSFTYARPGIYAWLLAHPAGADPPDRERR